MKIIQFLRTYVKGTTISFNNLYYWGILKVRDRWERFFYF